MSREKNPPLQLGHIADSAPLLAQAIAVLLPCHLPLVHHTKFVSRPRFPDAQVRIVRAREDETRVEGVKRGENAVEQIQK